jgi:hypothetical protein
VRMAARVILGQRLWTCGRRKSMGRITEFYRLGERILQLTRPAVHQMTLPVWVAVRSPATFTQSALNHVRSHLTTARPQTIPWAVTPSEVLHAERIAKR